MDLNRRNEKMNDKNMIEYDNARAREYQDQQKFVKES